MIAVNLKGPFLVTQAAVRQMVNQPKLPNVESAGKIVNISSTHEDIPFPNYTSYCAAKGASANVLQAIWASISLP